MADYEQNLFQYSGYLGSSNDYQSAAAVILGVPMDYTVSFKPGARFGPLGIRSASYGLEEYSVDLDRSLSDCRYHDGGNIWLPVGNVPRSLELIGRAADRVVADGKIPFCLGGEHLISAPLIRAVHRRYPDLSVLHFDAHADLRAAFFGEANSHAAVFHQVSQFIGKKKMYHFGIRSGSREEIAFGREQSNLFLHEVLEPLMRVLPALRDQPVYVSVDIDVADPAFAPGTGTPEPGGCTAREILTAIHRIGQSGARVVGFDLVEVAPDLDHNGITAILGAKLVREALLSFL